MNRFGKSLDRIKKNVFPQDGWTEEDVEHYKTITEALEICEKLPNGKPGDYVRWSNGLSESLYQIEAIVICEDCVRYDLGAICPMANHPNIVGILSDNKQTEGTKCD